MTEEKGYEVKIGDWMKTVKMSPMTLVRDAKIGVTTAYKASRNDPSLELDTLVRIYNRLKANGYSIEQKDVYLIKE